MSLRISPHSLLPFFFVPGTILSLTTDRDILPEGSGEMTQNGPVMFCVFLKTVSGLWPVMFGVFLMVVSGLWPLVFGFFLVVVSGRWPLTLGVFLVVV